VNFLGLSLPIVFIISSFLSLRIQIAVTSSPMMSGLQLTSIHWIIRFGGNAGVLLQAATEV